MSTRVANQRQDAGSIPSRPLYLKKPMDPEIALDQVGDGWSDLVCRYYDFLSILSPATGVDSEIEVEVVEVNRGMLRIVATNDNPVIQEMLDKLAWAIERDSALVCEVCGEKGFRRKSLEGTPNRCQPHYVELLNRLADEGKI